MEPASTDALPLLGEGLPWRQLAVGQAFRTGRRTVTETDLISFVSTTGMFERMFLDATFGGAIGGRPVPALLTQSLIEGFQVQTLLQGVGLALLETAVKVTGPVRIGDTVWGAIRITEIKPTSKGDRAVVTSETEVFNQDGASVLRYVSKRLIAGA